MISVILLTMIVVTVFVLISVNLWESDEIAANFFAVFMGGIIAALTLLLGALGISVVANALPHTYTFERYSLVNLEDATATSGSFFLASGTVDEKPVYRYYAVVDGAAGLHQIEAAGVKVYQDSAKPYVIQRGDCHPKKTWLVPFCYSEGEITEIHIPAGTITNQLRLDAK